MTDALDLELPADVDELARARTAIRRWLDEQGVEQVAAVDLLSVASEFLVHAIVRAAGAGTVRLVGETHRGGIRLSVRAKSADLDRTPRPIELPSDPLAAGALGRRLVETGCHELRITPRPAGADVDLAECWRLVPGSAS